jgi:hypothetical protein
MIVVDKHIHWVQNHKVCHGGPGGFPALTAMYIISEYSIGKIGAYLEYSA